MRRALGGLLAVGPGLLAVGPGLLAVGPGLLAPGPGLLGLDRLVIVAGGVDGSVGAGQPVRTRRRP